MKLDKKLVILAAAGAFGAVSASSAMAFENEFHGSYLLKYFISNYESYNNAYILDRSSRSYYTTDTATPPNYTYQYNDFSKKKTSNYFDTRARLYYNAKANDNLKLVTAFEIDSIFGDSSQTDGRNGGAALEADETNLETKWVYLDFKVPGIPMQVQGGIQPVKDKLKGIFFDADVAGINTTTTFGPATIGLGYYRAYDAYMLTTTTPSYKSSNADIYTKGTKRMEIVAFSADYDVNKNLRIGSVYYFLNDNRLREYPMKLHTFGLNFDAKINKLSLSGFAALQQGSGVTSQTITYNAQNKPTYTPGNETHLNGYAFNLAAKHPLGPGNLRAAFLYTSGDDGSGTDSAWQGVNQSPNAATAASASLDTTATNKMVNSYNESGMMLLNRNLVPGGTTTDMHLVASSGNLDQGVIMATMGYDATITPKWYANANVGVAWVSKNNPNTRLMANHCNFLGTEINLETGYKLYDNLTALVQGAYVFLGGYYTGTSVNKGTGTTYTGYTLNGKDPKDPYTARVALSYTF